MPDGFDKHVRTSDEAIDIIKSGGVSLISLDHDLGDDSKGTGYDVAKFIEEMAFLGGLSAFEVCVHSANPVGSSKIKACINNSNKYWGASSS